MTMLAAVTESIITTSALPLAATFADEFADAECVFVAESDRDETESEFSEAIADRMARDYEEYGAYAVSDIFYVTVYTDGGEGTTRRYEIFVDDELGETWAEQIPVL